MLLKTSPISTARFDYNGSGLFLADASDFGPNGLPVGRVYDDAIDLGFTLVSSKTGREVVLVHAETVRNADGDVLYDAFVPAEPGSPNVAVHVFND